MSARVAVLVSGRGSNMLALADACAKPDFPADMVAVLSDHADAAGLAKAAQRGIATGAVPKLPGMTKAEHEAKLHALLQSFAPDIICLAGYMRLLSAQFLAPYEGRIVNIHPSLLPRHKGLDTHAKALAAGDSEHGCTVHHVTAGMDEGRVIAQARVPVIAGDTPETLAKRVLAQEHRLYPQALRMLIKERGL
ncbi:MAG: phosphoribosylglycinamide formyltransferase [Pseudomonadota bacterium]